MDDLLVLTGGYSDGGESLRTYRLNLKSGRLARLSGIEAPNPSYLAAAGRYVYACLEVDDYKGTGSGAVLACRLDREAGALTSLNIRPSGGAGATNVAVGEGGRYVLAANYMGGSVAMLPCGADGTLGEPTCVVRHHGHGADPERQEAPHPHQVCFDRERKRVLVPDLGLDEVFIYDIDWARGQLTPCPAGNLKTAPGQGPRHCAFHPGGAFFYLANELGNTVYACRYDPDTGEAAKIQEAATVPPDAGPGTAAAIRVHPGGRLLFCSNRGHDSIAAFPIGEDGRLGAPTFQPCGGKTPRDFAIEPSGRFLIAANQDSGNLTVFRINETDGALAEVHKEANAGKVTAVLPLAFSREG